MIDLRRDATLIALLDTIVPADEHPSAAEAGVADFIAAALEGDQAGRAEQLRAGLARLDPEAAQRGGGAFADVGERERAEILADLLAGTPAASWDPVDPAGFARAMVTLTMQGFYGDPGNGGNRDEASWRMVGYRAEPEGTRWPETDPEPPPVIDLDELRERYDAVVVGSGAGGGVAACVLAEAGLTVLLVEQGAWLTAADLRADHLRSQRLQTGRRGLADPPLDAQPRVVLGEDGDEVVDLTDARWGNTADTVGGGTRVYGAQAWRFCAEDFRMASTYGVPAGSSLADWPIAYDDLAPDYERAEWELGVSGDSAGNRFAGARTRDYPMPPLSRNGDAERLAAGAAALGVATSAVPLLINSVPYNGRGACIRCGRCVGFGCPGEFKTDTRNTAIPRAIATGRCDVLPLTQATRIRTDEAGRVTGVALAAERGGAVVRADVDAGDVLLAGGAIETPRLLLGSASEQEPHGLGNRHDQVGRNLQAHVYAGAFAVFDEPVQTGIGPGPSIAVNEHRHHNDGIVGGAMLANDFVPMPLHVYVTATSLGLIPAWGAAGKRGMRDLYPRLALVTGPVQEVPNPESRVVLDPEVRDRFGVAAARLRGGVHPEDRRTAAFMADRAAEWARAAGAHTVHPVRGVPELGPSVGQHQAGTCRMGDDPASSVTDAWGRVWGHDNLRIVDSSLHVTNGGVNPVLTILGLAYRVAGGLAEQRRG